MSPASSPATQMEINPPKLYTMGAVLTVVAYGLLLAVPVLAIAVIAVSLPRYGIVSYLIPLFAIVIATFFLPFGFGNSHVMRLVRLLSPNAEPGDDRFIVQLTLTPRLRSGLRALLEDADDIGWLSMTDSSLVFEGDSIRLTVPVEQIRQLRLQSIGWRGLFVWGPRVRLSVSGLPEVEVLEFAERSSYLLPASRRTAQRLYRSLSRRLQIAS